MNKKLITIEENFSSTFDMENEEVEIQSGQYWRLKIPFIPYQKGTVLLINSLNIIDNILHSVELTPHPLQKIQTASLTLT